MTDEQRYEAPYEDDWETRRRERARIAIRDYLLEHLGDSDDANSAE